MTTKMSEQRERLGRIHAAVEKADKLVTMARVALEREVSMRMHAGEKPLPASTVDEMLAVAQDAEDKVEALERLICVLDEELEEEELGC